MAKKKKEGLEVIELTLEQVVEAPTKQATGVFTHKALSTCNEGIAWFLVEIDYNPETGEVGPVKKVPVGDSRIVAMERYKIASVNHKVFGY